MTAETRIAKAVGRLADATSVIRAREVDAYRAERDGKSRDQHLEDAASKLESAADELWAAIGK